VQVKTHHHFRVWNRGARTSASQRQEEYHSTPAGMRARHYLSALAHPLAALYDLDPFYDRNRSRVEDL